VDKYDQGLFVLCEFCERFECESRGILVLLYYCVGVCLKIWNQAVLRGLNLGFFQDKLFDRVLERFKNMKELADFKGPVLEVSDQVAEVCKTYLQDVGLPSIVPFGALLLKFFLSLDGTDVDVELRIVDEDDRTALCVAAESADVDSVMLLLALGSAKKDCQNPRRHALTAVPGTRAGFGILKHLVEAGLEVDAGDEDGYTALTYFMFRGYSSDFLTYMLEKGSDPFKARPDGKTPVYDSINTGNFGVFLKTIPGLIENPVTVAAFCLRSTATVLGASMERVFKDPVLLEWGASSLLDYLAASSGSAPAEETQQVVCNLGNIVWFGPQDILKRLEDKARVLEHRIPARALIVIEEARRRAVPGRTIGLPKRLRTPPLDSESRDA
jgi:hypothetical protein